MEEVEIERLAAGGDGVSHLSDGRALFVAGSAPGDRLRIRVFEERPRFARGQVESILSPGPARRAAPCAAFGECGGCDWQHLEYAAQLSAKRAILADAVERLGGIELSRPPEIVASPDEFHYRSRARLRVEDGNVGYRARASHRLVAVETCPILAPALEDALRRLAESPPEAGEWELALGREGEVSTVRLDEGESGSIVTASRSGPRYEISVGGERLALSPGTFAQANHLLFEALFAAVMRGLGGGECLVELYAGAGFFTLGAARRYGRVVAVEAAPGSVVDLRHNLERAGLEHVEVVEAPALRWLETAAERPDAIFCDPPRAGLGRECARAMAELRAPRIVYLSCDPATLARDLAELRRAGYALTSLCAYDLFPQTAHVEALALLELASGADGS